jgi:hypothetical protein
MPGTYSGTRTGRGQIAQRSGRGKEVIAVVPLLPVLTDHRAYIGFVHQRFGFKRLARPLLRLLSGTSRRSSSYYQRQQFGDAR